MLRLLDFRCTRALSSSSELLLLMALWLVARAASSRVPRGCTRALSSSSEL